MKPVETGMAPALLYTPESIKAAVGDMVMFVFMQKNHTATQSTFAEPCKKMAGGMDSGFMANPEGKAGVTWNMTVENTEPLCTPSLTPFLNHSFTNPNLRVLLQATKRYPLRQRYGL
jgi:hypothetical protein